MSLLWPGEHRARDVADDGALVAALVAVEQAWLDALVAVGAAPPEAAADLAAVAVDPARLAVDAEPGGNPVIPLVAALRAGTPAPASAWLHRGLTSQDVLDTALVLCARDAVDRVRAEVAAQVGLLRDLVAEHRDAPALARTLTQPAAPSTVGLKAAAWLHGLLDADDDLAALRWPVQLGGAAGTLAAVVELVGVSEAQRLREDLPRRLGLDPAPPWHTRRAPVTRLGDALVTATDAWSRLARDVLALGRPEVGEVRDTSAGGSSAMPHKANPTLAVLVRRAGLAAPVLAATLHTAAADQVDERADGAWHAEWDTLGLLLRRTVVAASHTTDLLRGLVVDTERAAARLATLDDELRAEQRVVASLTGRAPQAAYDGVAGVLVDEALARADRHLAGRPADAAGVTPTRHTPDETTDETTGETSHETPDETGAAP